MLESDQESNWSVQFAWGNLHHMWIASRALFCLCLWKHITGASPVSVRPQGIQWKKQKGSQESDCWECKQQSQGGRVKDQSRSQSRSWSGGNRSAARRREELEAVPRRLTNGNIWRLNYPLKGKKERERTLGLSLLSVLIKFKGPQVGIPQGLWWEDGFPSGSAVKNLPAMQEPQKTGVQSMGRGDPLKEGMATHSSILAWRIPWTEEPGRLQSMGPQRVGQDWSNSAGMHEDEKRQNLLALLGCMPSYTAHPSWWWHLYGQWLLSLGP